MQSGKILTGAIALSFALFANGDDAIASSKKAASGNTQIVAKLGAREITLSELRVEMSRLGLASAAPDSERVALQSLVNRLALASEARKGEMHRRPEAILRMHAAQDQALADLYLSVASQPPEPLRREIDDYIAENPGLFTARKIYDFDVLSMPSEAFEDETLTPLFDQAENFDQLTAYLDQQKVNYSVSLLTQTSGAFPKPIREQLASYDVDDNIVLKGDVETKILKITNERKDRLNRKEWAPFARRVLMEQAARKRADNVIERIRKQSGLTYYRQSAKPLVKTASED